MGIPSRSLSRATLAAAGVERTGGGGSVRARLLHSLAGYVWFWLAGEPPTVTHHDKQIRPRTRKGGGRTHTLEDSPELRAAKLWYLSRLPERAELIPLRPPVVLRVEFRWALPPDVRRWPEGATYGGFRQQKPDLDNLLKGVTDALALRGWLVDDSHVTKDGGSEKRWCRADERPGVRIFARTLMSPIDGGNTLQPNNGERAGVLYPAPWVTDQDVATTAASLDRTSPLTPNPENER